MRHLHRYEVELIQTIDLLLNYDDKAKDGRVNADLIFVWSDKLAECLSIQNFEFSLCG